MRTYSESHNNPIFIIGALNRSGTNYLADIVLESGRFEIPQGVNEDYLLTYSDVLFNYVEKTIKHWSKEVRKNHDQVSNSVLSGLGNSLLEYNKLLINTENRLLFKCPRPDNLKNAFKLFPNAKYILCIRDGRDTVESFTKSFNGYSFKQASQLWAKGVENILDFEESVKGTTFETSVMRVKYELLATQDPATLQSIATFCDLDKSHLNAETISSLPLKGSSTHRGKSKHLHWEPVPKPKNFQPQGRWNGWSWWKKSQFKRAAQPALIRSGYVNNKNW